MKIGCVNYLNALPYHLAFKNEKLHLAYPTTLTKLLLSSQLDIALTSSITPYLHNFSYLETFGIAANGPILSVNLYLKKMPPQIIALTEQSSTSIALLKILCRHFWNISPQFTTSFDHCDAYLLIGDDALTHIPAPEFSTIDLAKTWLEFTGLPFVFALFSYRTGNYSQLEKKIDTAIEHFEKNREEFCLSVKSPLSQNILDQYYSKCVYRLGQKEHEGLKLFHKLYVQ